jgi:thiol-disulfide isomerase/thioredoxin
MIASLFVFSSSLAVHLTNDNFSTFLNTSTQPIFIKLWASWCPHCKEFAPTWDELSNTSEITSKVHIADIECEANRESCKGLFTGANYPRLFWIDLSNRTAVPYFGARTLDHFRLFITKQLNFPMILVNSTDLPEHRSLANSTSIFHFAIPESDTQSLTIAQNISTVYRHMEAHFLLEFASSEPSLVAYTGIDRSLQFSGNWTFDEISDFVLLRSVPFMAQASHSVMRHLMMEELATFIHLTNVSVLHIPEESLSLCEFASGYFPVTRLSCDVVPWFCRYIGVDLNVSGTQYVIYNRSRKLFWVAPGGTDVRNWLVNVSLGRIGGSGPGDGFLSPVLTLWYDQISQGKPAALLIIGPVIVVVAVCFAVWSTCEDIGSHRKRE